MPNPKFAVKYQGVNDTWVDYFHDARARWNRTHTNYNTGVAISYASSANAYMTAGRYAESWYGLYTPSGSREINRSFKIQVNARSLAEKASNLTNWIASTSTHELGHALSLKDNPNTSSASLMKYSRNRSSQIAPSPYDVSEVKRIY